MDLFKKIPELIPELSECISAIKGVQTDSIKRVTSLSHKIQTACLNHPDEAIATVHLLKIKSPLKQSIFSAILGVLLAKKLKYNSDDITQLLNAILTANMAFIEYQVLLNSTTAPLTEAQLTKIRNHPIESVNMLKAVGVNNPKWLSAVVQHHERLNGTGYPKKLKNDEICTEALIVAICEFYTAMIDDRAYRATFNAREALQELYGQSKQREKSLYTHFIKVIGIYPPGSFVQLANNEKAVVYKRVPEKVMPIVKSVFDPKGNPYAGGIQRDCNQENYKVICPCQIERRASVELTSFWQST